MTLTEPTTLVTDLLLGGMCLLWSRRLIAAGRATSSLAPRLWAAALTGSGAAAILGGVFHGFRANLGNLINASLWRGTVYLTGIAAFFLLLAVFQSQLDGRARTFAGGAAAAKLVLFLGWTTFDDDFRWVVYDFGATLLLVAAFQIIAWARRQPQAPWILSGVAVALGGGVVQQAGVSLHRHFNHNDLFHVIQMLSFYLLYRGGMLLRDSG